MTYKYVHETIACVLITILAFLIRLSFLFYFKDFKLLGDEIEYWDYANQIANGVVLPESRHPPLWNYILAIPVYFAANVEHARIFAAFLGSIAAGLICLLACLRFQIKIGIVAGILIAFDPTHIGFSTYFWVESFFFTVILVGLILFTSSLMNKIRFYLAFLIAGTSFLIKEYGLIILIAMQSSLFFEYQNAKERIWSIIKCTAFFLTPLVLFFCFQLLCGNSPSYDNALRTNIFGQVTNIYNKDLNLNLSTSELIWNWLLNARISVLLNSFHTEFIGLWGPQSFVAWRLGLIGKVSQSNFDPIKLLIILFYLFIITIGTLGLILEPRSRLKSTVLSMLLILLVCSASIVPFHLLSRFRVPFMWPFYIYGGAFICSGFKWRRNATLRTWLAIFLFFSLILYIAISGWGQVGKWG